MLNKKSNRFIMIFTAFLLTTVMSILTTINVSAIQVPEGAKRLDTVFRDPVGTGPAMLNDGLILQVTPAKGGQVGGIWSKDKVDLTSDFQMKSYIYLGNEGTKAADGMTFTLQNDPRMDTSPNTVYGYGGMGLGAILMFKVKTMFTMLFLLNLILFIIVDQIT